jgi:hypothetical protein
MPTMVFLTFPAFTLLNKYYERGAVAMSIQVELKPEVEVMLQKRALDRGCDVAGYVERLIEKDVLAAQSFDEILAPIRQGFQESGMSEDELDTLFEEAREDAFQARQAKIK